MSGERVVIEVESDNEEPKAKKPKQLERSPLVTVNGEKKKQLKLFDLVKAKPSKPKLPTSASSSPKENKDPGEVKEQRSVVKSDLKGGEERLGEQTSEEKIRSSEDQIRSSEEKDKEEQQRGVKRKNTCSDDMEVMDVVEEGTPKKRASLEMFIRRKPVVQELNKIQEEDKEVEPVTPTAVTKAKESVSKTKEPVTPKVAKAKEPVTPKSVTSKKPATPKIPAREEGVTPKSTPKQLPPTTPKTPKQCSPMDSNTPVGGDGGSPTTVGNTTPVSSKKAPRPLSAKQKKIQEEREKKKRELAEEKEKKRLQREKEKEAREEVRKAELEKKEAERAAREKAKEDARLKKEEEKRQKDEERRQREEEKEKKQQYVTRDMRFTE
eukprot:sb/3465683/